MFIMFEVKDLNYNVQLFNLYFACLIRSKIDGPPNDVWELIEESHSMKKGNLRQFMRDFLEWSVINV